MYWTISSVDVSANAFDFMLKLFADFIQVPLA
jgi:hypothetical protein